MNLLLKTVLISTMSFLIVACTLTGAKYAPLQVTKPGEGNLYVYRPSNTKLGLMSAWISIDGKKIASLENGGYVALSLKPGDHTITQQWKAGILGNSDLEKSSISLVVRIEESKDSYVGLTSSAIQGPTSAYAIKVNFKWQLSLVPLSQALPDISKCRKVEAI